MKAEKRAEGKIKKKEYKKRNRKKIKKVIEIKWKNKKGEERIKGKKEGNQNIIGWVDRWRDERKEKD